VQILSPVFGKRHRRHRIPWRRARGWGGIGSRGTNSTLAISHSITSVPASVLSTNAQRVMALMVAPPAKIEPTAPHLHSG
jgi:hypothetical protein